MQVRIPFAFMRGGTSRAAFFMEEVLPTDPDIRDKVILASFGSPDPYGRQIDGIGGAVSSTSKVAIINKSRIPDTDINYRFGQVSVTSPVINYKGNCGNISAAVGPFAVEESMIHAKEPITTIRIWQENTKKIIIAEVPVKDGRHLTEGDYCIDGIPGTGAKVTLRFLEPGGAVTNKLLPTGNVKDFIKTREYGTFTVSIIDAANPVVFVRADELRLNGIETELNSNPEALRKLETIRSHAAVLMGVASSPEKATPNLPFVAFVSKPREYKALNKKVVNVKEINFVARMLSMGSLHGAFPGTGAICVAGAAKIDGTVVNEVMDETGLGRDEVRIGHPSGLIIVKAIIEKDQSGFHYVEGAIGRTARRLAEGFVLVPERVFSKE